MACLAPQTAYNDITAVESFLHAFVASEKGADFAFRAAQRAAEMTEALAEVETAVQKAVAAAELGETAAKKAKKNYQSFEFN